MVEKKIMKELNKFEQTRLFSTRALELVNGAEPKIKIKKKGALLSNDYLEIAKEEFKKDLLDLEIYN